MKRMGEGGAVGGSCRDRRGEAGREVCTEEMYRFEEVRSSAELKREK